jgi:hypothetical protein
MNPEIPARTRRPSRQFRSSRIVREHLSRRIGESLMAMAAILIGLGWWLGGGVESGAGGAIARFLLRLFGLSGLLFASWGVLLRWHRHPAGGLGAGALAVLSQVLLLRLLLSTGFEAVWLPWLILGAAATVTGFGLGAWRWRATRV